MKALALIGLTGLVAVALLVAACSQQPASSQAANNAPMIPANQAMPPAPNAPAAAGAPIPATPDNTQATAPVPSSGTAADDLIGNPTQPSDPGDTSVLSNASTPDAPPAS